MIDPFEMTRRGAIASALAMVASASFAQSADKEKAAAGMKLGEPNPFSFEALRDQARELADSSYTKPEEVPKVWRDMGYDQYRMIWFAEKNALWRGTDMPVQVDFLPAGYLFDNPVKINVVAGDKAQPIIFDLSVFDKTDHFPDLPADGMGFSGFRLRGELEKPEIFQEYAVFQGASYFRALGKGQVYGLSARGLALGTGSAEGEEFPDFREFWIEAPAPDSPDVTVYALLDSPSVAGAYKFIITKGENTVIEVESYLYPRKDLDEAGIAPGTSMFLFDETNRSNFDDFRDAVHDSDGLLMQNGAGERIWRPLSNPRELGTSYFHDSNTSGFGLMQRARDSSDFEDLEAHYHDRPSLWVEPIGEWGPGFIGLIEIPTDREVYDNIVAFWRPKEPLKAGEEHAFSYRLHWCAEAPIDDTVAKVINTRTGQHIYQAARVVAVDFAPHDGLGTDPAKVEAKVHIRGEGKITSTNVQLNPATKGLRLTFTLEAPEDSRPELRAELRRDGKRASEIWLYRWGG